MHLWTVEGAVLTCKGANLVAGLSQRVLEGSSLFMHLVALTIRTDIAKLIGSLPTCRQLGRILQHVVHGEVGVPCASADLLQHRGAALLWQCLQKRCCIS
jgi:hypothetical protein